MGVSGGPDSVCMLDVMAKLAPKYNLQLIIAHVNYGLRGKDSEKDEKFVRKLAGEYGLEIKILKSLRLNLSETKISESALREIRYKFFEKVRKENSSDLIAVAHNLDDQAETFLMRIIRGAGLKGLAAMKYKSVYPVKSAKGGPAEREFNRGTIIRPLLGITREEILEYLKGVKGIRGVREIYRTDRTNKKNIFLRNKVRNKLIPYLEKNFNPKIKKTIFNAAASVAEDYSLIQEAVEKIYGTNGMKGTNKAKNFLSVKKLLKLHPALQRRVLLKLISEKKPDLKDIESAHIEEILKALRSTKGKSQVVIFKGLKLTRKNDKVTIENQITR